MEVKFFGKLIFFYRISISVSLDDIITTDRYYIALSKKLKKGRLIYGSVNFFFNFHANILGLQL